MKVEVGKVYKCGDGYVKILFYSEEHDRKGYYCYVGMYETSLEYLQILGCTVGMFGKTGAYSPQNSRHICHDLKELIISEKQQKLDRIATMEKELKQLKEEIENE